MGWFSGKRAEAEAPATEFTNTIDAGTVVKGDLKGRSFRIDGTVDGLVDADGPVQVGETGTVTGCVRASDLTVLGRVEGDVEASGHLEVGAKGRVIGDVSVQSFRMHKGGVFRGVSRMADEGAPRMNAPLVSQKRLVAGETDITDDVDVFEDSGAEIADQAATGTK